MRSLLVVVSALAAACSAATNYSSTAPFKLQNTSYTAVPQLPRNGSEPLKALYQPYSNKTPVFKNDSLIQALSSPEDGALRKRATSDDLPEGACAPGIPCKNGACCSNTGVCSYAPSSCAPENCISNCDAKAPCGQYAKPENAVCPLNVCCSQYGFCKKKCRAP